MTTHIFFFLGLTLLIVHEMDAVKRNEWKMFIYLSTRARERGYAIFALLHIPLFLFIFWGVFAPEKAFRNHLMFVLDVFFIVHFFLHLAFIRHRNNQFKSIFSWSLIIGLFLSGVIDVWK